ncbi:MAG: putative sulfate exporter family transporter [Bradyrhizobium sp.]
MIVILSTKLAKSLDGRAGAGLPSIIQRWPGRNSHEILPGLFLNWVIAGAAFAIRQLPGMAMFNPMMLSMAIGIAFHNIVGTAAWAKQGVTFSLRRLLGTVILSFGSQLTSSQLVTHVDDKGVVYAIACVFGSVAMLADPIAADAEAWIVAATTSLSIALAAIGPETNIGKLTARGFRPAWLGTLALPFIAGFSLTLIKLME